MGQVGWGQGERPLQRLLMFELSVGGHYPGYIQHLVRYWRAEQLPGELRVVVTPEFLRQHEDVVADAGDPAQTRIQFIAITAAEAVGLSSRRSGRTRAIRAFQEWRLLEKYVRSQSADHCLIPYLDTRQLPLALGMTLPCPFSGIYFRPTFHYPALIKAPPSRPERWQHRREKLLLGRLLANPQLQTLFCLDPFVLEHLQPFSTRAEAVYLPDPVQRYPLDVAVVAQLKQDLRIDPERRVCLLFGALDGRKGIHQLLEATALLSADRAERLCLLLVGPIASDNQNDLLLRLAALRQRLPVQIICADQFVPDAAIGPYFQLADVILAPYQRHVGMSAILVRAAVAQKPVLASDYGLMGEITRRYALGVSVDSTQPVALAAALDQLLQTDLSQVGDRAQMQAFAAKNSAYHFAQTIFRAIWNQLPVL
jgi:glycosyltransferase involved in cell wall biosynthesis